MAKDRNYFGNIYHNIKQPFTNPAYQDIRALGADSGLKGLQIGSMIGTSLGLLGGITDFGVDLIHGDFNPGDLVFDPIAAGAAGALTGGLLGAGYGSMMNNTGDKKYDKRLNKKRKLILSRINNAATNTVVPPTVTIAKNVYSGASGLSSKIKDKFQRRKK